MENRNKPRVFLSHSKKDEKFIKKLYKDLLSAKIEPWLDTEEIRDGKPWLKVIFENGLPTCDVVIIYLSEHSIQSKMVNKEIDSALIENMSEANISILPYISDARLRNKLRVDLKTLQCREWNNKNYSKILPSVISEIWHNYLERTVEKVTIKVNYEKEKLLNEYNVLKEKNQGSPFTKGEEKDFEYIYTKLDIKLCFKLELYAKNERDNILARSKKQLNVYVSFLLLLISYVSENGNDFYSSYLNSFLYNKLDTYLYKKFSRFDVKMNNSTAIDKYLVDLKTYGLIKNTKDGYEFSNKMYKLKYWLGYYDKLDLSLDLNSIEIEDAS